MTLPVPRYIIGEKVYFGYSEESDEWYDCESCLGTMEWHVVTPAGEEFDIECPACTYGYICCGRQSRHIYRPFVRELTIGSVRIDTAAYNDEPVAYMCEETGVGSGSVYYETMLADNRETAMSVAKLKAAAQQQEMDERKRKNDEEAKKRAKRNPSWHEKELRKANKRIKELKKMVKEFSHDT